MDHPDNTENNLNISLDSEYFLEKHANPAENDLLAELFQTHLDEDTSLQTTGVENVNDLVEEAHNSDVDLPVPKSPGTEREKTPDVAEVKSLIERLKQDQIDFKEKYYEAQSLLVDYECKLSEYMNSTMKLQAEVDALKESSQLVLNENSILKMKLDEKEAELKQFKGLVQKQVTSEEDTYALKKEMAEITKALKKSEKMYSTSMDLHNKRIKQLVKYKRNYRRVMTQLLECSEILTSNKLLPLKHIKNLEHFMESYKDINLDSEDISEDSSLSLEEESVIYNHSAENNTLTNGTCVKPNDNIISPNEESPKSCLSSHLSTSGYLSSANMESSTNIKLSPLHQNLPSDTKSIHCEASKNDNSHVFQLPFSPAKSKAENSSNERMQKNKIMPNNATETAVSSRFSDDMEVTDDSINLNDIMGSMVMKVEDLNLISPIPESPLKKFSSYSDKIRHRKNDLHTQTPYKNSSIMPKNISPMLSNDYKKNRLSHQTSSGFEPHIEEKSESIDSSSNTALITGNPFQTPISPNLHYLSSAYTNNTFQILHQGSSALDYIANSDTKFTAFVLTIPKKSPRNGIHNNKDDYVLPCIEERLSSVQSLYNSAIKPETSNKKGILDSKENKTEDSVNDPFSYICVQIDSKNGQINLKSNLQNNSVSDNHSSSPCLTIEKSKSEQINLSSNQGNNYVSNKCSNPCLSTKKQLSEVVHEENLVPEYMEQEKDDNQSFVSDSCGISPHKRNLAKTLHYHSINENNLPIIDKVIGNYNESSETNQSSESEGNKSLLPNQTNKHRNSLSKNHPHLLSYPKSSAEPEKSLDMSLNKQFSTFGDQNGLQNSFVGAADKVLESSEKEDNFILSTCNLNRAVTNETAIVIFDNDKTTISSPESNIFVGKNMSEDEMQPAASYDNDLQNGLSPVKDGVNFILNTCKLNSEAVPSETAISAALESNGTSDKMTTSTPKCISVGKNKSIDEMSFAVTYDNNLQNNLPHVKQKLFQDSDSESHTLPSFKSKSYDTFDNSDKSNKEWEKTIIKHTCLGSTSVINSNSDKEISDTVLENKKLHNFSNSSTENVPSTDVELPAFKKRKLVKSPFNLFSKNESIPILNDKPPEYVKTITESSPTIIENFQSSIHLINHKTADKSYGVFKTDDVNFSSSCDEERNTALNKINSPDSPENIEKDARQAYLKSPNVIANKNDNDSFGIMSKSNLSNASKKRKTKGKNKRKKKDLSSSIGICPKSSEKSLLGEISQHFTSFMSGLQSTLKSQSSDKKLSQTDSNHPSCSILGQNEIKSDLNSPGLKKNDAVELETNTQINSGAKVSNKNICNILSLENTITKRKEKFIHRESLNVQEIVNSSKSSEENETSAFNIDQEKLTDKDNLSIKEVSNNQLKMIEKNGKVDSSPSDFETNTQINSGAKVNYGNNCNISSLENTITKERVILCQSFNNQEVVHSSKSSEEKSETFTLNTDKEELTDKDNLSTIKVSNNQLKMVEENGKINSSSDLPSEDLLNHKEQHNPSSLSHVTVSESIKAGVKQQLCLKEDAINIAAANDISSEEHSKVSFSHTLQNIENVDDSQNETHKILRHNSCQSIISDDENPLVIAEDDECNSISETPNIVNNEAEAPAAAPENSTEENDDVPSSSEIEKPVKNKKKRRKHSKAHNANKRKKSQSYCEEESISNSCTIQTALDDIKKMKFEEMLTNHSKYKLLLHKLISALINPANAPNTTSALHQVFSFLSFSKLNPLVSYPVKKNTSVFFPPAENCIVEALIKTESKKKIHLQGLIPSAISTLYYLILDKKTISKTGLGALCRIFTQLCKLTQNKQKPIKLTCDLINEQHPLAPVLIAFIIGTWVEIFEPPEDRDGNSLTDTDVFRVFHLSCIYFGLQKKPSTVTSADWNACKAVFNLTSVPPLPTDTEETINMLISSVENLVTGPPSETDEWACDQMLIIAVTKGWTWTQEKLVNRIISLLHHYAKDVNNERAYSLYAELCADIGKQAPNDCLTILEVLSTLILDDCDLEYVRKHAAQSLLKLLLFKHLPIPEMLTAYIQENENNLNANVELYLRRRCIADVTDLTESDILIT